MISPDRRRLAGALALFFVALVVGGALAGLVAEALRGEHLFAGTLDAYLLRVAGFTLWQAALSTLVSVVPGLVVARAFHRHPAFPGRGLALGVLAVPIALPAIVAALGVLALWGRAGLFAPLLSALAGGAWPGIYGLSGILVAHAFFNVALSARLFLGALDAVPADSWRLASQLGLSPGAAFRLVEWPALRASLPGTAGLVFMLCVSSFTVVLTLGGGPGATTLEVAIYQALRFDFDPARAVALTLAQLALTALAAAMLLRLGGDLAAEANLSVSPRRFARVGSAEALFNALVIALALLFVGGPLVAVVWAGVQADLPRLLGESAVRRAAALSLALAAAAALLAVALAWSLAAAARAAAGGDGAGRSPLLAALAGTGASFVLVIPPIVVGAGWFVLLRRSPVLFEAAPVMVAAVNALMAMPFALRLIRPAHDAAAGRHDRLCRSLGLRGWNRLMLIDWPALRRPVLTALSFAAALSLGDLGVIALWGSDAVQTLPYLLLARMGSYRTADAAGLALLLGLACLALIVLADRLGRARPA